MKWKKYTIDTTTAAVDFISEELNALGIGGIEIEDNVPLTSKETKGMFIDILPELPPDDGRARVSFYLSADDAAKDAVFQCGDAPHRNEEPDMTEEELLTAVRERLQYVAGIVDAGPLTITQSETEDKDWMNAWKDFFHTLTVGRIIIRPEWEEMPEEAEGKTVVTIRPGSAFGTGSHETTQLCLRQLSQYVQPGMRVLDVGCGSGILGITALRLGASSAIGTDLDPEAITATQENCELNGIRAEQFPVICGNIIDDRDVQDQVGYEKYDIATANILAPVICALVPEVGKHMKSGGVFIASGIVQEKESDVREAFARQKDLEILEVTRDGEWVSFTARRR